MYTKTRTNLYRTTYHLVWVTKYRKVIFTTLNRREAMMEMLSLIAENNDITILESEVMEDHIHLVVSFPPNKKRALEGLFMVRKLFRQYGR